MGIVLFDDIKQLNTFILSYDGVYKIVGEKVLSISFGVSAAKALTSWIRSHAEEWLIRSIYKKSFVLNNDAAEFENIVELSTNMARSSFSVNTAVFEEVLQLMENKNVLSISGIIRFRLNNYKKKLSNIIEKGIETLAFEREKANFIELLQYFVSLQEPVCRLVHITYNDERYSLVDECYNNVNCYLQTEFHKSLNQEEITQEDQLLSSLISIAPERIVIHDKENKMPEAFAETLKLVFGWRLVFCKGCGFCKSLSCQL